MSQSRVQSIIWYEDQDVADFLTILLGEHDDIEVNTVSHSAELVKDALNGFLISGEKKHLFLPISVHSVHKDFSVQNHWVGIHAYKVEDTNYTVVNYFDPMGHDINSDLRKLIEAFYVDLKVKYTQLQIAELIEEGDIAYYEGNTNDCGPMLCYMLANSFHGRFEELGNISLDYSRELGQILRAGHDSKKTLDELQSFIVLEGKERVTAVLQDKGDFMEYTLYGRDKDSNNFVAQVMLNPVYSSLERIKIATELATNKDYRINTYLNVSGMDSHARTKVGGLTLAHVVVRIASKLDGTAEEKQAIGGFFKALQQRNINASDAELFNPNYPTMNPSNFVNGTDLHMISTSLLISKIPFKSEGVRMLCKKYFASLLSEYDQRSFEDDSGDSEDEEAPAHEYKKHLLEFDRFVKSACEASKEPSPKATRTMDKYQYSWGYVFEGLPVLDEDGGFDQEKFDKMLSSINTIAAEDGEGIEPDNFVVPLFHGVPMMSSQYTNFERREIFKKFALINKKLMGKYSGEMEEEEYTLTEKEEIILGIHSRTATASTGIQSLYEMINAPEELLRRLAKTDEALLDYFAGRTSDASFKEAMKIFIFEFMKDKTAQFWTKMKECSKNKEFPTQDVVKYRFPSIATSKTPDHPSKFAIGNNVEGNTRGETAMKPDYVDGMPTHRFAGLLYVTFHRLQDLVEAFSNGTGVDVNRALDLQEITPTNVMAAGNLQNQQEVDFFGKSKGQVVAVIPVIYPHIRKDGKLTAEYHQAIWGINTKASKTSICNPQKILQDLQSNPNPSVGNKDSFGKVMMPTLVDLAHGVVLAVSDGMGVFPCTITKESEIKPYDLRFDHGSTARSEMHKQLSSTPKAKASPARVWEKTAERKRQDLDGSYIDILDTEEVSSSQEESVIANPFGKDFLEQLLNAEDEDPDAALNNTSLFGQTSPNSSDDIE